MNRAGRSEKIAFEQVLLHRYALSPVNRPGHLDRSIFIILSRIHDQGPMTIGELSAAFGLDVSTLNRQTASALRQGLLERLPATNECIARRFGLTPAGQSALDSQHEIVVAVLDQVMSTWSDHDVTEFGCYLERFNLELEKRTGRHWPRHPQN
ncbi:MarR family winged helix-turn-helix transcriptional regulator [Kineosporia babensis]|uniref:MarR family transcriptional regulator n=1 Tax=Kineosporia babensis TaxID=499548 RepID=A0A9X1NL45_9ACTN|nr:MarR family transcriptional regulator [Kineosporia babensis]